MPGGCNHNCIIKCNILYIQLMQGHKFLQLHCTRLEIALVTTGLPPTQSLLLDLTLHLIELVQWKSSRQRPSDQVLSRCFGESHPQASANLLFGKKGWNKKALHDFQQPTVPYAVRKKLIHSVSDEFFFYLFIYLFIYFYTCTILASHFQSDELQLNWASVPHI